ncbi:hypothetical protein C5167_015470 [Papaver somniferum]|uniref:MULE transposase domain-containing protein n=1 Tax=Papaver somniferum TaxID=3469 RepID=A0A4Y7JAH1_PAPSO|nr:hypothetical protein C5167_015470 [Papaver somniferum]
MADRTRSKTSDGGAKAQSEDLKGLMDKQTDSSKTLIEKQSETLTKCLTDVLNKMSLQSNTPKGNPSTSSGRLGLSWRIIKMTTIHTCTNNKCETRTRRGITDAIADVLKKKYHRCDSVYTPRRLQHNVKIKFGLSLTYKQAYLCNKRGMELCRGIPDDSYQHLVGYSHMLSGDNPDTVTKILTYTNDRFVYYFLALGVSVSGFISSFRPAFALDGTCLAGERLGVLLTAVALDANEQSYPLAFAIVDVESKNSWEWFLCRVHNLIGNIDDLTVISDRGTHVCPVVENVFRNRIMSIAFFILQVMLKRNSEKARRKKYF